jgi:hypothetical protein
MLEKVAAILNEALHSTRQSQVVRPHGGQDSEPGKLRSSEMSVFVV